MKDPKRVQRLVSSGLLSGKDAGILDSASQAHQASRKGLYFALAIGTIGLISVTILGIQNFSYRTKMEKQSDLMATIDGLEKKLETEASPGVDLPEKALHSAADKTLLVAKLRAAERQLRQLQDGIQAKDWVNTYSNPLGLSIHRILQQFGKQNYIVPDLFIQRVERHIKTFSHPKNRSHGILKASFARKAKYYPLIERELLRENMPTAFFYVAMHESALDPLAISHAGARGLWQFMPRTARQYGLHVPQNWRKLPAKADERTDPEKSTRAGVKYLKRLMVEFGDVALAMASYNAGEGRIRKALRKIDDPINDRDFWYIYRLGILAKETNEYVPKIIATMIIDKNRSRYGF
ncbi:lytic transglycosylase domain-containing protein [Okeania sp. SIO1H5]|uniref:lytic transglycosylase domain-containing protein n=1 Tax=Okeania sp. SIO1H5 TaxID=2607777 RepID=UPI002580B8A3|nr:lytic transglycosylase domain-containing protein [Okeania sp. SIO1H5]